ncbi:MULTISPECIES: L,D-transpeptidase [Mesorhizobium]|uniref:L,D-transpeptidase n=1 Tax=Mesorhizobium denitrificans TaxID=2294114 RepID=A0A371XFN5_9HYPH|nr:MULTISPECIES: L,D-transpeptidase [Mesorhizobium]RFC68040.1 L,D-transpeptidase [Mesorhizobium denitrificans]
MKRILAMAAAVAAMIMTSTVSSMAANLVAHIDIATQTMTVTDGGRILHRWPVSTARNGYYTPRGSYKPTRMHKMWYSRKYDMTPMPYSVFFRGGYAIHGTTQVKRLGRPASHGCVRLATGNARAFYELVRMRGAQNTRIVLTN